MLRPKELRRVADAPLALGALLVSRAVVITAILVAIHITVARFEADRSLHLVPCSSPRRWLWYPDRQRRPASLVLVGAVLAKDDVSQHALVEETNDHAPVGKAVVVRLEKRHDVPEEVRLV